MKALNINWKEILHREYIVHRKSCVTIAGELNCGRTTVLRNLHKHCFVVRVGGEVLKGSKLSDRHKRKVSEALIGKNTWMKGRHLTEKTKKKIRQSNLGKKVSKETRKKISVIRKGMKFTEEHCKNISKARKGMLCGKEHWNWKGGKDRRETVEYIDWRLAVYEKDKYTCVACGDKRGHNLQAHHIMSFAKYPDLRLEISNGVTLCKKCHAKLHPDLKMIFVA